MDEKMTVRAPYNFIPFAPSVLRYDQEIPSFGAIGEGLLSGEIEVSLKAETPVFVSNGRKKGEGRGFFRAANGTYAIPGASVRGMLRETMQILGFGLVRSTEDLTDRTMFCRDMASSGSSVRGRLKRDYTTRIDVRTTKTQDGRTVSRPSRVHSGYLVKESGVYRIYPTKQGKYYRISRNAKEVARLGWSEEYHCFKNVGFKPGMGDTVSSLSDQVTADMRPGVALFTGKPVGNKPNSIYVFPERDTKGAVEISREDQVSYELDWEMRSNALPDKGEFWKLPQAGEDAKPVFYTQLEDGHVYFGMTLFPRIGFRKSIADGLPAAQLQLGEAEDYVMDYPHAILGYIHEQDARRSRVSVGEFYAVGSPQTAKAERAVLGEPKPSYYAGYLKGCGSNRAEIVHYNEEFELRGYKQYWLKDGVYIPKPEDGKEKENVMTELHPLEKGTEFNGVIRFRNLREEELGLLLWCIALENQLENGVPSGKDRYYHSIGMGKPYGFGRMALKRMTLRMFHPENMYSTAGLKSGMTDESGKISELIECYVETAGRLMHNKKGLRSMDATKDFFFMKRVVQGAKDPNFCYMELGTFEEQNEPLPTVAEFRGKEEKQKAEEDRKHQEEAEKARKAGLTEEERQEEAEAALLAHFGLQASRNPKPNSDKKKKKKK